LLLPTALAAAGCGRARDRGVTPPADAAVDAAGGGGAPAVDVAGHPPRAARDAAEPEVVAAGPREPAGAAPPSPALAAHLSRIPEGPGPQLVARVELQGLAGPGELRAAARRVVELLGGDGDAEASCLVELLGGVRAVTYVWQETDGPDAGLALVDTAVGLPLVLPCLASLGLPVPGAEAAAGGDGVLALTPQVSAAAAGDGTLAVGETALVRAARAGSPARPLGQSAGLARARALAGDSPVWVVWFEPDGAVPGPATVHGGIGLRLAPRLGVEGTLAFADATRAGALAARGAEVLAGLHRAGETVLQEAAGRLSEGEQAPLRAVLEAARTTRFVVEAGSLSFESRLPAGFTVGELLGALVALEPILELL
jgi:hypothetical protein